MLGTTPGNIDNIFARHLPFQISASRCSHGLFTVCCPSFSRDIFFRLIGYPSTFPPFPPPSYSGKKAIVHLHRKVLTTFSIPLKSKIDSRKSLHNSLLLLLCLIIFAKLQTQDPFPVLAHWKIAN